MEKCRYWHTSLKQVKRHRDSHFKDRYGYMCPDPSCPGKSFTRHDGVNRHCHDSPKCAKFLEVNGGKIECWGTPANETDLVPQNPEFHIPYYAFDGRTG